MFVLADENNAEQDKTLFSHSILMKMPQSDPPVVNVRSRQEP